MASSTLNRDTLLVRRGKLDLRLSAGGEVEVRVGEASVPLGVRGLTVLEAFATPVRMEEALSRLAGRGLVDWMELTSTVVALYRSGVLVVPGREEVALASPTSGFGAWQVHAAMLNDRTRTGRFLAAIAETVKPGDVVVDLGTGSGILALAAARAGARRVYAVEATGIGEVARRVFAANGVSDCVTLLSGWSTTLDLPEPADVLITETIGNDPFGERILEIIADAWRRFASPHLRVVPRNLCAWAVPFEIPAAEREREILGAETLASWREHYGFDLDPLAAVAQQPGQPHFWIRPQLARNWRPLGEPVLLTEVSFESPPPLTISSQATLRFSAAGSLDGVLMYFSSALSAGQQLSTHPSLADPGNIWRSPVWVPEGAIRARAGDELGLKFEYGVASRSSQLRFVRG